ncbi:MAG TPA: hypothetical protein VKP61_18790 [Candidatus Acidoferrum sp.]|nr:hypothetical protein [Candidatus Acidoferrum sp.]
MVATMIVIIVTIMSGTTAKTVPIAYTWAKGTESTANSTTIAGANRATTGGGVITIQIATNSIVKRPA